MKEIAKKWVLKSWFFTYILNQTRKKIIGLKIQVKFGKGVFLGFSTELEGNNWIGSKTSLVSSYLGYGSYIASESKLARAHIGRFCSIGRKINCIFGKHPSSTFVSTHPSFFSIDHPIGFSFTEKQLFEEEAVSRDSDEKYSIIIGNDVWIGEGVSILDGVLIGDGAIVAAGALVTKDVAPYTIVGGVPAKVIRKRFTEDQINFLLDFQWWNKDLNWIRKNAHLFTDIESFMEFVQKSGPE